MRLPNPKRPLEKALLGAAAALLSLTAAESPSLLASPAAELEIASGDRLRVRVGDAIPGLGQVTRIDDETIVVERVLSDAERAERGRRGLFAPDVERRIYPRPESLGAFGFDRR